MTLAQESSILALIGSEPVGLKPIEIQKLMFMYTKLEETIPLYDFIPYEQGCYSPTLAQDVHKLAEKGFLKALDQDVKDKKKWALTEEGEVRVFAKRATIVRLIHFLRSIFIDISTPTVFLVSKKIPSTIQPINSLLT